VLIHSGAGAVGLAAIQVAKMLEAEIYTTVSNEKKREFLINEMGIPADRIENSRDVSFARNIMKKTNGNGVDLALNSLAGELLHATWGCVAKYGTMVQLGKRDALGMGKLDMGVFQANRNYCSVDLDQMATERPHKLEWYEDEEL
jgi:NADPH:quinone reductase-like Zn-dependent oxidoreductase